MVRISLALEVLPVLLNDIEDLIREPGGWLLLKGDRNFFEESTRFC